MITCYSKLSPLLFDFPTAALSASTLSSAVIHPDKSRRPFDPVFCTGERTKSFHLSGRTSQTPSTQSFLSFNVRLNLLQVILNCMIFPSSSFVLTFSTKLCPLF